MKKRGLLFLFLLVVLYLNPVLSMEIMLNSPINQSWYNSTSISVNASSNELVNWISYLDGIQNNSLSISNSFSYTISGLLEGSHALIISASNSSSSINKTAIFYIDSFLPSISSQTPANNSNIIRGNVTFSLTYTEANLNSTMLFWKESNNSAYSVSSLPECRSGSSQTCSKIIDLSLFSYGANMTYFFSMSDITSKNTSSSNYIFQLISCTPIWQCSSWSSCSGSTQTRTCTDSNSCGVSTDKPSESQSCTCTPSWDCSSWTTCSSSSQSRTCTDSNSCGVSTDKPSESQSCTETQSTDSSSSSDSSSNSNSFLSYMLTDFQLTNGVSKNLRSGDKILFRINNESHSLEAGAIYSNNKILVKLSSTPQYANLSLGESKKFDLTGDKYYDLQATLQKLTSANADIFIKSINEKIPKIQQNVTTPASNSSFSSVSENATESVEIIEQEKSSLLTGALTGILKGKKKIYAIIVLIIVSLLTVALIFIKKIKMRKKHFGY